MRRRIGDIVVPKVEQVTPRPQDRIRYIEIGSISDTKQIDDPRPMLGGEAPSRARQRVRSGDVLVSMTRPNLNAVAIVPDTLDDSIASTGFDVLRATSQVLPLWLFYRVQSQEFIEDMCGRIQGVVYPAIRPSDIRDHDLPVPSIAEQQRIVAAIETHFSRIEAAVSSLTRAKANVKRARASVLKAAVEGRLVPTEAAIARAEGRDYEPASVLLERILAERKATWAASGARGKYKEPIAPDMAGVPELPEGWSWASMDELINDIEAGKSFAADSTVPSADEIGIVKVSAVTWGVYDEDEAKTVHDSRRIDASLFIDRGDLLISRANTIELVGAVVIAERVTRRTMLSDKILRLNMPRPFRRWIMWVLRSHLGRRQIKTLATGNQESMRNIGQDRIRRIVVPLPPLAEQHRIVAEVDRRFSVLDALDATIDANLARCARLRQAILERAFEGRLVPAEEPGTLSA